jgi:hypothetical protein
MTHEKKYTCICITCTTCFDSPAHAGEADHEHALIAALIDAMQRDLRLNVTQPSSECGRSTVGTNAIGAADREQKHPFPFYS